MDVEFGEDGLTNFWVEDSVVDTSSIAVVQGIMAKALRSFPPGDLLVTVLDESLGGISAPFEALNSGGERLLKTLFESREFGTELTYLRSHVHGVNNVIQGLAPSLSEFRKTVDYEVESYHLVVVSADVSLLDDDVQNQLAMLLRAGPRAGVRFVIHSITLGANPYLLDLCRVVSPANPVDAELFRACQQRDPRELIDQAARTAREAAASKAVAIGFDTVQPLGSVWEESSAKGLTCSFGRFGRDVVSITLGDEVHQRHNMLITGAVGQGKSNLISALIHSWCHRYSPDELQLYLLDFKEGVTLQPFAEDDTFLPHAKVLGLDADREFGFSVLQHLFSVYKQRMAEFKACGVQSLQQYRELYPDRTMPRLVAVIDEFQMLFTESDHLSDQIADLLVKGARLFRASGIHFVLCSQTIGGNLALMGSIGEGLFGQVPVRIALKNSVTESYATLGIKNDAAAHLRARQAIVNLEYGEPLANRKTNVAFADERILIRLRAEWAARNGTKPYVFRGERRRSLDEDLADLRKEQGPRVAYLGSLVEVGSPVLRIPVTRELGRNFAFIGGGDASRAFCNTVASLAFQGPAEFVLLDGRDKSIDENPELSALESLLRGLGQHVEYYGRTDLADALREISPSPSGISRFVVGFGLEKCRSMPPEFMEICQTGPLSGLHMFGWWSKYALFDEHIGYGGAAHFDTKIAFRTDATSLRQFFDDPLISWAPTDNRALVSDFTVLDRPRQIIPYTAGELNELAT